MGLSFLRAGFGGAEVRGVIVDIGDCGGGVVVGVIAMSSSC